MIPRTNTCCTFANSCKGVCVHINWYQKVMCVCVSLGTHNSFRKFYVIYLKYVHHRAWFDCDIKFHNVTITTHIHSTHAGILLTLTHAHWKSTRQTERHTCLILLSANKTKKKETNNIVDKVIAQSIVDMNRDLNVELNKIWINIVEYGLTTLQLLKSIQYSKRSLNDVRN